MVAAVIPASKVASLWSNRRILKLLVARDVQAKHADSMLGHLWSVLEPLLMAGVYWFVFTKIFQRSVGEEPYIVFLLCGLLPWQWANSCLRQSTTALNKDSKLVRSTNLPREIWVLRLVLSKLTDFGFALPVLAMFAILTRAEPSKYMLLAPVALVMQTVLLVGWCLVLAPISALYSDVQRLMGIGMRLLFYGTPVLYALSDVDQRLGSKLSHVFVYNPLVGVLELYRASFFPGEWVGWRPVIISAIISVALLVIGLRVFDRLESRVLKEM